MIEALKTFFSSKRMEKPDFSSFFNGASIEERKKLMEKVVRKANEDQRAFIEHCERT